MTESDLINQGVTLPDPFGPGESGTSQGKLENEFKDVLAWKGRSLGMQNDIIDSFFEN